MMRALGAESVMDRKRAADDRRVGRWMARGGECGWCRLDAG